MEKRRVIICDDEEDARLLIKQYMGEYNLLELVRECANGIEAAGVIDSLEPDLVFLDIQMPGLSGFQVLQKIVHVPQIIFTTAFDKYALKAFDNNAADYLLKPYTKERFNQAVTKALLNTQKNMEAVRNLSDQLQTNFTSFPDRVLVEAGNRMISIAVNDIYWIEAHGDYTRLHTTQRFYLSSYSMTALEQKLNPAVFLRIHRSAIINIHFLKEVKDS